MQDMENLLSFLFFAKDEIGIIVRLVQDLESGKEDLICKIHEAGFEI